MPAIVTKIFSDVGVSNPLHVEKGESFTYAVDASADPFDGRLYLEYTDNGGLTYVPVPGVSVITADVSTTTKNLYEIGMRYTSGDFRFRCELGVGKLSITGTADIILSGVAEVVMGTEMKDDNDMVVLQAVEGGVQFPGTSSFTGSMTLPSGQSVTSWTLNGIFNGLKGANISSASTINLDSATGNYVHVTGVTGITTITLAEGRSRVVTFDGILALTHGANLILPGSANITTSAGDCAVFIGEGSGAVRCVAFEKGVGEVTISGSETLTNKTLTSPTINGGILNTGIGADIAAAATLVLDSSTGPVLDVTGNTGITAVTLAEGRLRWCRFSGTPLITNGASLICPGGNNIQIAAGDWVLFAGDAGNVARVAFYQPYDTLVTLTGTQTLTNKTLTNPVVNRTGQKEIYSTGAKVGATAGWTVNSAADTCLMAVLSDPASSGTNEQQTLTPTAPPTQGTYKVNYGGSASAAIAFDANGATITSTLEAVPTIGADNLTATGTLGTAVTLEFKNALGDTDVAAVTISDSSLASDAGTNERQDIEVAAQPISGAITITTAGGTTASIPFNSTAAQIKSAIEATGTPSTVTCVGNLDAAGAHEVNVTFGGNQTATDADMLVIATNTLKSDAGTNERQDFTAGASPVEGTWKFTFAGNSSAAIAFDANAAAIQSAIEGTTGIGAGNVSVTGDLTGPGGNEAQVTFQGALAATDMAQATVSENILKSDTGTNERQDLEVSAQPVSGAITITTTGGTTASIPYTAQAADIKAAIEATGTPSTVTVVGNLNDAGAHEVNITFGGNQAATDTDALVIATNTLKSNAGTNEQQTLTPSLVPDSGNFLLSFGGQNTAFMAYNVSAANIQTALEGLSTIGAGNVSVAGTLSPAGLVTVTFQGTLAATDVAMIAAAESNLLNGVNPVTIAEAESVKGVVPAAVTINVTEHVKGVVKTPVVLTPSTHTGGVAPAAVAVVVTEHTKGVVPAVVTITVTEAIKGAHTDHTNSTLVVPISGLKTGDTIVSYNLSGQVESAGNTVSLRSKMYKHTSATSDVTITEIGDTGALTFTEDTILNYSTTAEDLGTPEVLVAGESIFVVITGSNDIFTDVALQAVEVTITEA